MSSKHSRDRHSHHDRESRHKDGKGHRDNRSKKERDESRRKSRSPNRRSDRDDKKSFSSRPRDDKEDRKQNDKIKKESIDVSRLKPEEGVDAAPIDKEAPNFEVSGKLLEDTNTFNGVVVKYSEPPEARKPKRRWRFYVFKGQESLPVMHLHRQSAFLIGKDRKVCDLPVDHPSCSRQHAVLQYRLVNRNLSDGTKMSTVVPYIIDLGSSNGTFLNNKVIDAKRYVELREKDVLKFGYSSREYVLLHDQSEVAVGGDSD